MSTAFLEAVKQRRTYYGLSKERIVSVERVNQIVHEAVKHTPSAFNSQSSRAVVLYGEQSNMLWEMTKATLRAIVPADQFPQTEKQLNGFASGYGTVLFFEDTAVIENLQEQYPSYAAQFPSWSDQSSGILQYIVQGNERLDSTPNGVTINVTPFGVIKSEEAE